jgi:hypothetical protein
MTEPKKIPLPIIHLNGTSAGTLAHGYGKAYNTVTEAMEAMNHIEFNARDYYPEGPEYWEAARDHHLEMRRKLREVHEDLELLFDHCEMKTPRSTSEATYPTNPED